MTALQGVEGRQEALRRAVNFLSGWQEKSRKSALVSAFFNLLVKGRWAAANRVLDRIKQDGEQTQWRRGYVNALEGMIAALEVSGDKSPFIYQIRPEKIGELRKTFMQGSKQLLHAEFDRGYFAAWADYTQTLRAAAKPGQNAQHDEADN